MLSQRAFVMGKNIGIKNSLMSYNMRCKGA